MSEHHDLPFKAEYAKSNRSSCKGCAGMIAKDSLRLAIMVQSPMFDGKVPNWYHFKCFWKRAKVGQHTDVHGIDSLRWEDQEKIKNKIAETGNSTDGPSGVYSDYVVQYAKSNRSTCQGCENKIDKNLVRISKKDFESQRAKMYGPQDRWYHVDCFVTAREDLAFGPDMNPTKIPGYETLTKEDKEMLIEKLGKGEKKKRKSKSESEQPSKKQKKDTAEEKALKAQYKLLWSIRDNLQKEVSNNALKGLLEYNRQEVPSGESQLLDRVSDCMAFGALVPCPECKGQLAYSMGGYKCTGNLTEWTKCLYFTKTPKRKPFKIPSEYHDVEFLKKYKYVERSRVIPSDIPSTSGIEGATSNGGKPLDGMSFVIGGKLTKSKADVTKCITELGGKVNPKVDKSTTAVISTKGEVEKNTKVIKDAKKCDVHVISEDFLDAVQKGEAVKLISEHSICDWGSDAAGRVTKSGPAKSGASQMAARQEKDEKMFTKSVPATMKMTVKGGAAVDPDSGLEDSAHVLQERGEIYTAVLGMVDIMRGTNSYYKLQLLESETGKRYYLFRSWGRVGTTIGGNKLDNFISKANAIEAFEDLYADKTGNLWKDKKNFKKQPYKFYPIDIDYGTDEENIKSLDSSAGSTSKLPKEVQTLVKMIFDVGSMKKAMLEYEIDLKKMPLGKLSNKQIKEAYKVLTELNELLETKASATKFLDASNRFYTLIPHDFGMKKPPLLDTAEIIKAKTEMLDNLLDIEIAYSLLKGTSADDKDPIDAHYEKLKTKIEVLDKNSEEVNRIKEYVKNTHAATHKYYELEVEEVFKIKREGEDKRYRPFRDLSNRMLLWHGSRKTNFGGILSQGLRIAPPEAPVTGYMFGKGIYFADMVSKSANYCFTSSSDDTGLLLLCEVALGNMHELTNASYITALPKGKHSTKGLGRTQPDPKGYCTTPDGVVIPMGEGIPSGVNQSSLLYNEYIVYDVAQVNMKYLIQMKFKY